ncbi:hypothetical protein DRZ78_02000 [Candidatus Aerophobetes bacterium]|uniref:Uncharacterized protein n=1 Tax=Aerophobetes bacterium TaxID=2030807 RepID=A0A662D0L1_UNCAE|nr:MAG: hypothetical protein DRZ78_02000 [Candidatus Aerophobetes bacterium]
MRAIQGDVLILMELPDLAIKVKKIQVGKIENNTRPGSVRVEALPSIIPDLLLNPEWWVKLGMISFRTPYSKRFVFRPLGVNPYSEEPVDPTKIRWYWKVAIVDDEAPGCLVLKIYERANLKHLDFVKQPFEVRYIDIAEQKWVGLDRIYEPAYSGLFDRLVRVPNPPYLSQ